MNILITGTGRNGSWKCRGEQLGGAVGRVVPNVRERDLKNVDLIVLVKRIKPDSFTAIKNSGIPFIWDLVDLYPQPLCSTWTKSQAVQWIRTAIQKAKPNGLIWPNRKMQIDCDLPGVVIYHHSRDISKNPIRETVKTVGYEGSSRYLEYWRDWINAECKKRGWKFQENCKLNEVDIALAVRSNHWAGYVQKNWKSNVKLANCHGSGTPFVGQPESGYTETCAGSEVFIENQKDLSNAFDYLEPHYIRKAISEEFIKNTIKLETCADHLKAYAKTLC